MSKTKTIKEVDEKIWREFRSYCLNKNMKMGEVLNKVLSDFLKNYRR